jgi:nucleosome binding factor SPN SPT16 subunit
VTKDDKNAGNFANLVRGVKGSFNGAKLGVCSKDAAAHPGAPNNLAAAWLQHAAQRAGLASVEAGSGWSHVLAEKDAAEVACVQKAAVMSNKVLKHGFVKEMEAIFEEEGKKVQMHGVCRFMARGQAEQQLA